MSIFKGKDKIVSVQAGAKETALSFSGTLKGSASLTITDAPAEGVLKAGARVLTIGDAITADELGGLAYVPADDDHVGRVEVTATNGQATDKLAADLYTIGDGSGNALYFTASDDGGNTELWRVDAAGRLEIAAEINPGRGGIEPVQPDRRRRRALHAGR